MAGDAKPLVAVVFASDNDLGVMSEAIKALEEFGIPHEVEVTSAHRSPQRTHDYVHAAEKRGVKVFIVGAGAAAHLAGVIASLTTLPVVGVPLANTSLGGADALYATVQMPAGVPVATMALDKAGARNAGIFAAEVLALYDSALAKRVRQFKEKLERSVAERAEHVKLQLKRK